MSKGAVQPSESVTSDEVTGAIVEKLRDRPSIQTSRISDALIIEPLHEGGFKIAIYPLPDSWTVYFGDAGFHENFSEPAEAIDFVGWGLSNNCRLVEIHGVFLTRIRFETFENCGWSLVHEFGFLKWPTSLQRTERVFQNHVLVQDV